MAWEWVKANAMDVAKFATDEALQLFTLDESSFDLKRQDGEFEALLLLKAIYETLVDQRIPYDVELESTSALTQRIRTPVEILQQPKQGTCLDLALLFCGLCLGYGLLPKLVILEGHALAVVSLNLPRNKWDSSRDSQKEFLGKRTQDSEGNSKIVPAPLQAVELIKELVDDGLYAAIECTGFSWSKTMNMKKESAGLPRDSEGYFSFEQALQAGRQQLDRLPFQYAIDIEVAHKSWGIEPEEFTIPGNWQKNSTVKVNMELDEVSGGRIVGAEAKGKAVDKDFDINQKIKKATGATIIGWQGDS